MDKTDGGALLVIANTQQEMSNKDNSKANWQLIESQYAHIPFKIWWFYDQDLNNSR